MAALVAADRWSLWRTLSRGLAHQLANAGQMLAIDPLPPGARAEAAERISVAQARLSDAHRDGAAGPTLVRESLEDVQALQRLQSGFPSVELGLQAGADLPAVAIPAEDLRHILLALVTNAKLAAAGGRAAIRLHARTAGEGVEIIVEDDGPGLPTGWHERAFDAYASTRPGAALGIGLTVARALARRAGGSLDAEGGSSRLRLRLPAWRRAR